MAFEAPSPNKPSFTSTPITTIDELLETLADFRRPAYYSVEIWDATNGVSYPIQTLTPTKQGIRLVIDLPPDED